MPYTVLLKKSAEKELDNLPNNIQNRIINLLFKLEKDPRPRGAKKLRGMEGYRLRTGEYRILYMVSDKDKDIEVYSIAHRKDVYR